MLHEKVKLKSLRIHTPDCRDEQVWIQSSCGQTYKMPHGHKDDFSFTNRDILLVSNRGEDFCTVKLEGVKLDSGDAIFIGSNRRAGCYLHDGQRIVYKLKPGEVLTARDINAREKQTGVEIKPGQAVVLQ